MKILASILLIVFTFTSDDRKAFNELDSLLDKWHQDAAKAKFEEYFEVTSDDFYFLGTAPGEKWGKKDFQDFSKPYFDKGKAWDFTASNRQWYGKLEEGLVWFDEDLETWMEDCRGSGVFRKIDGVWKLEYYNLTVLIENEKIKEFIELRQQ